MKKFFSLVGMQLRDKLDMSWTHSVKEIIKKCVFSVLKFVFVFVCVYMILFLGQKFSVFYYSESLRVSILIITLMFFLSLISCTVGITQSLYFNEDNKVLVTLPMSGIALFLSKLLIFYIDELKKAMLFTIPVVLACFFFCNNYISVGTYFWMIIPLLVYIALPVLLGSLLSIGAMYIKKLFNKFPIIEGFLIIGCLVLLIVVVVKLINLIPENINLLEQWGQLRTIIRDFLLNTEKKMVPFSQFVYALTGEKGVDGFYHINGISLLKIVILFTSVCLLFGLVLLIIKPIYFHMMTKNFEFNKKIYDKSKSNKFYPRWITFMVKEFKLKFRDVKFYTTYVITYIIIPILILLLNRMFYAMSTSTKGTHLSFFFNFLLILLPLLSSNSKIATEFSVEGRAAYIKKTKPIKIYWALSCKFIFNALLALPSIIVSCVIVGIFSDLTWQHMILLTISIILLDYAHILISAGLDLMNPQNEQYATLGTNMNNNPNENRSTIFAFALAFVFAFLCYFFLKESYVFTSDYMRGSTKLLIIAFIIFGAAFYMYLANIKAYYYEK
ncbi:MAG: hypothetical protein ACI311_03160 [Bacilli bacterium]